MTLASCQRVRLLAPLLLATGAAWLLLAATAAGRHPAVPHADHIGMVAWMLMLPAMMLPLLRAPLLHLRARSLARHRARASAEFLTGYFLVWVGAGPFIISLASVVHSLPTAFMGALVLAAG